MRHSRIVSSPKVTDAWRRAVDHYTDLKRRPVGEQLLLFSEDVAIAVTGSSPNGMVLGPGLVPLANEFLHRNLGLDCGLFRRRIDHANESSGYWVSM